MSLTDIVSPCHGAPLLIATRTESGCEVPEVLCSLLSCGNEWDAYGVASEWNTPTSDPLRI